MSELDYPKDAGSVRDMIKQMMVSQVDHGSSMDTGGGQGAADLWLSLGGVEYLVTVKFSRVVSPAEKEAK